MGQVRALLFDALEKKEARRADDPPERLARLSGAAPPRLSRSARNDDTKNKGCRLNGAVDAEFAHACLQGSALHAEDGGGALGSRDAPLGLAEDVEDVLALSFVHGTER